jgi:hypothetical protein
MQDPWTVVYIMMSAVKGSLALLTLPVHVQLHYDILLTTLQPLGLLWASYRRLRIQIGIAAQIYFEFSSLAIGDF